MRAAREPTRRNTWSCLSIGSSRFGVKRLPVESALAEQPGQPAVLEHASAGLALRAVIDRVLLEVDARDRRPAHVARLAEMVVHAVRPLVVGAALPKLEPTQELGVDRAGQALDLLGRDVARELVRRERRV